MTLFLLRKLAVYLASVDCELFVLGISLQLIRRLYHL